MIQQEFLFQKAFGFWPDLDKKYLSPIRPDRTPGCFFKWRRNYLRWWDNAYEPHNGINGWDALAITNLGHKIRDEKDLKKVNQLIHEDLVPVVDNQEHKTFKQLIEFKPKEWSLRTLKFWAKYGITEAQLREDKKYDLLWFSNNTRDERLIRTNPESATVYTYPSGHCKIYRHDGGTKWFTNCDQYDVDFENDSERGDLFILGSYKDARVVKNAGFNTRGLQSETQLPLNLLAKWNIQFDNLYYVGDIDKAGILCAKKHVEKAKKFDIDLKPLYLYPIEEYGKDIAEFREHFSNKDVNNLIKYLCVNS